MRFLTYYTEAGQTPTPGIWITLHNQLFQDDNGVIYLVPRYFLTDGYTIPEWCAAIAGGKMKWDSRPAIGHDLECKFHQCIRVKLSETDLRVRGYLRTHSKKIGDKNFIIPVCDDIPARFLVVEDVSFNQANSRFKRMMLATGNIKKWRVNLMRFAVNFNIGWIKSGKEKIDLSKLYKECI